MQLRSLYLRLLRIVEVCDGSILVSNKGAYQRGGRTVRKRGARQAGVNADDDDYDNNDTMMAT